jgi:hypothetical protein
MLRRLMWGRRAATAHHVRGVPTMLALLAQKLFDAIHDFLRTFVVSGASERECP